MEQVHFNDSIILSNLLTATHNDKVLCICDGNKNYSVITSCNYAERGFFKHCNQPIKIIT